MKKVLKAIYRRDSALARKVAAALGYKIEVKAIFEPALRRRVIDILCSEIEKAANSELGTTKLPPEVELKVLISDYLDELLKITLSSILANKSERIEIVKNLIENIINVN